MGMGRIILSSRLNKFGRWQHPQEWPFFPWKVSRECILTIDMLMKRDRITVNRCFLCKLDAESCNHITLWWLTVYSILSMVYDLWEINWVMAGSVRDELWAWAGLYKKRTHLLLIPLSIRWVVWKERNASAFDEIERDFVDIRDRWIHTFGFMILDHEINRIDDFRNVIDHLIDM